MSATIKYKGNTIATASNNTKTLLTAGKYLEANVVVTDNGGGGGATLQTKSVTYTPSASQQTDTITPDAGYDGLDEVDVTVNAVSAGSATTPATTITANPTISISGNSVSASVSKTQSITPTVSAGYVSSGTAGNVTVSGSDSATIPSASAPYISGASISNAGALTTDFEIDYDGFINAGTYEVTLNGAFSVQAAQTIYPSTSDQSIASGKYLTGTQTILGDADLVASNIKKDVSIFGVTGTYEGGGGGTPQILYTNGTATNSSVLYSEDTVIGDDVAAYTLKKLVGAPYLKTLTVMRTGDYGGSSYQIQSSFKGCPLLEEVTFYNGCPSTGYCEDMVDDCPNLKSFTFGAIGYPNTVGMGPTSGQYKLFRNVTVAFDIIIYTTATSLATVPSNLTTASPWGATNATVIYKNSVTGEVLA